MATLVATAKGTTSNSYATLSEANTYMETVRSDDEKTWLKQTDSTRERLLILATRLIDDHWIFLGTKTGTDQSLQWPRNSVAVDGKFAAAATLTYLDSDIIPSWLQNATAELARICVDTDPTADPDGAGLRQVGMSGLVVTFNEKDRMASGVMKTPVYGIIRKYGTYKPSLNSGQFLTAGKVTR
jgi:hypothetical protein